MKKILLICYCLFFISWFGYGQEFQFAKTSDIKNIASVKNKEKCFTFFVEQNKETNEYLFNVIRLKEGVNVKLGVYKTLDKLSLESYHVDNNQLVFSFSKGKRAKRIKTEKGRFKFLEYVIVAMDLETGATKEEVVFVRKFDYKIAKDDKTFFLTFDVIHNTLEVATLLNVGNVVRTSVEFSSRLRSQFTEYIKTSIKVIDNQSFRESIGISEIRLYHSDDSFYLVKDGHNFKKHTLVLKIDFIDHKIVEKELKYLKYSFVKPVREYNSYLLKDDLYLFTRKKKELAFQVLDLKKKLNEPQNLLLNLIQRGIVLDNEVLDLVSQIKKSQYVPSVMVYDLKNDSEKRLIVLKAVHKEYRYYHDPFFWNMHLDFHNQMMQQQNQMMQQHIQSIQQNMMRFNTPGGFNIVEYSMLNVFDSQEEPEIKFLMSKENEFFKYNDEEISLQDYDYEEMGIQLKDHLKSMVKKYESRYLYKSPISKSKVNYTYYNKSKNSLLTGVLELKKSEDKE